MYYVIVFFHCKERYKKVLKNIHFLYPFDPSGSSDIYKLMFSRSWAELQSFLPQTIVLWHRQVAKIRDLLNSIHHSIHLFTFVLLVQSLL